MLLKEFLNFDSSEIKKVYVLMVLVKVFTIT